MRQSAYNHFKSIYGSSEIPLICIDDKLKTVFATSSFYEQFGQDSLKDVHLNCVLPNKHMAIVLDNIKAPKCLCFEFVDVITNSPQKATIIPTEFEKIFYFVIMFAPSAINPLDSIQKHSMQVCVNAAQTAIAKYTTDIVSKVSGSDIADNVISDVLKIRKLFYNIESITTSRLQGPRENIIELNTYLKRITAIISKYVSKTKLEFCGNYSNKVLLSKASYEALDIVVCNIAASAIRDSLEKVTINVGVAEGDGCNVIVFSTTEIGFNRMKAYCQNNMEDARYGLDTLNDMAYAVVNKVVHDCGGEVRVSQNVDGGYSFGVILKKAEPRTSVFYTPEERDDIDGEFSVIKILLSDI